jgi:DNA repair exonuclease SbcCD ATPase subunit
MTRPLAYFLRVLDAARTAGTLARTVLVLSRQLDNAHLLAASEEARADRAELRIAELEAALQDWREASGELAAEQPAADPLPDLTDAGEAPIPLVLTDSAREADIQRDRADALQAALRAAEVELVETRARLTQTERAAGAHIATIEDLRARLDLALRAVHRPAAEQIPGVAAAPRILRRLECTICPYVAREIDEEAGDKCPNCGSKLAEVEPCDACGKPARDGERTGEAEAVLLCSACHQQARAEESARILGADDDPPATKESSR